MLMVLKEKGGFGKQNYIRKSAPIYLMKTPKNWDFEDYGLKAVNWDFPKDDVPHCEIVLRVSTSLQKTNGDSYSFSGSPLPYDDGLKLLENLKKSADLAIKEIKKKVKSA